MKCTVAGEPEVNRGMLGNGLGCTDNRFRFRFCVTAMQKVRSGACVHYFYINGYGYITRL
jgi:hypothetical protein